MLPTPTSPPDVPFQLDTVMQWCATAPSLGVTILDKLSAQLTHDLADIEDAVLRRDAPQLARLCHSLKGAAAMVGAQALSNAASGMERMGDMSDLTGIQSAFESLRHEIERCFRYLPTARRDILLDASEQEAHRAPPSP
jgi:HPt (histidine-containing phosphotransfer) domain-containing protein